MGKIASTFRILRAGWIMTREGVIAALPFPESGGFLNFFLFLAKILTRRIVRKTKRNERLASAMARLGPSYVKLGQFLATRPDIIGKNIAEELSFLQDRMETFPRNVSIQILENSFGKPVDEIFEHFSEPIAAASIAQVHHALIKQDDRMQEVAVKIIRPGVRKSFAKDLESYLFVAQLQERYFHWAKRLRPVDVVQTLAQITKIEMDLRLEAAALAEFAENIKDDVGFRVPKVDWSLTSRDVLTMEWIEGIKLNDLEGLRQNGHDPVSLATILVQSFLRHTLYDGFFHADMHPGNLLVEKDSTIVALDFGIMGRLGKKERRFLAEILYGFITRDFLKVAQVHIEAGYVPYKYSVSSFSQAIRAIGEPIHGQSAENISMAKLLTLLFEITETFDMETQPDLLMLQKTMVVVEGVARTLDPSFDMWKTAEPVVSDWMQANLGPAAFVEDVYDGYKKLGWMLQQAPDFVRHAVKISQKIDFFIDNPSFISELYKRFYEKKENKFVVLNTISLWVIAACFVYIVWSMSWRV